MKNELSLATYEQLIALKERNFKKSKDSPKKKKRKS
jgi:hypothetical protein